MYTHATSRSAARREMLLMYAAPWQVAGKAEIHRVTF
jgi:hypothetical protein